MIVKLLIDGGDMKPGPAIAQQLGPMGINMGQVISKVNEGTKEFKGMKIPVELDINEKTKEFTIKTSSPPTSELLKKELKLEKGSHKNSEFKMSNGSIEDIIKITKIKHQDMLEKDFKTAIKSVLGTCASIGILVENKNPNELIKEVVSGKFDKEINEQKTETEPEKRQKLNEYFTEIKKAQDLKLKESEKAKAEKEEKETAQKEKEAAEKKAKAEKEEKK